MQGLRVCRDERGAILLLAVFFGILLVALLYAVVGIGETLWAREGLQDAADAGAFSAAILHARGMNLIAFINIVMAALIAVLIACRVIQGLCLLGIGIAAALASPTFGASLSAVPPLESTMVLFQNAHEGLKPPVLGAVSVLHKTQWMVSYAVPPVAVVDSVLEATRHHPPARFGVALPGGVRLPVEPDRFEVLCERGGETIADLALFPFDALGLGVATRPIKDAVGTMTGSASAFFCGAGGASPPVYERTEEVFYPKSPQAARCEEALLSPGDSSAACDEAERELAAAKPDPATGNCRPDQDCTLRGPYVRLAREARAQCQPRDAFAPVRFRWQERKVRVEYTYRRNVGWIETGRDYRQTRLHDDAMTAPCGPRGKLSTDWNLEPYPSGRVDEVTPLCAEEHGPPEEEGIDGDRVTREHVEATHLFGCVTYERKRREPFAGGEPLRATSGREPHRVPKDVELGSDTFQIRSVSWGGDAESAQAERVVSLATWGRAEERAGASRAFDQVFVGVGSALRRLSVAQAEYYYDHDGSEAPSEWLWNMKWTARLVRFRMPEQRDDRSGSSSAQSEANSAVRNLPDASNFGAVCRFADIPGCDDLDETVSAWERFILH